MIFPASKDRLLKALKGESPLNKILKIGLVTKSQNEELNIIRKSKGWNERETRIITMNQNDVIHILKRIEIDKLTPEEVILIAEHAFSESSDVNVGYNSRALLENPTDSSIEDNIFTARAVLIDGQNYTNYRLYGLIPKGWKGRK